MKKLVPTSVLAVLLVLGGPAAGEMCTLDVVPAATLLLPYFEVDLAQCQGCGVTTLFSINNALPDPTVAHVVMWTDWAVPTIDFDFFLTGYDVVTIDLYDVFINGRLPITADEQTDPADTISPHGRPEWDATIPSCMWFFPYPDPVLSLFLLDRIQNGHTGYPTAYDGTCIGEYLGDDIARGYVTIDNVNECNLLFPGHVGYFGDGGTGVASNVNQLWGDFFIIDPANASMSAQPLVHVEADDAFNSESTPTNYTFYGRYVAATGIDNREPLGTVWGVRYLNALSLNGDTDFLVWRDPTSSSMGSGPGFCTGPDWMPLNETNVVCFDEEENYVGLCAGAGDPACFPLATQRVRSGAGDLALPFDFGWCYLNLNIRGDTFSDDVDFPASPPGDVAQSWVGAMYSASGVYSGGMQAVALVDACEARSPTIAVVVFEDGFESGDTSAWSSTLP